jgi:hypothetical protein
MNAPRTIRRTAAVAALALALATAGGLIAAGPTAAGPARTAASDDRPLPAPPPDFPSHTHWPISWSR